ncbi:hypothetical protein ILUMI_09887 [Ignelater luminosus]|uniref:Uncharacterized protein n=1 Tax=Ignelater luminosus TaxID=2038154 RepID=A0A8K0CZ51_IGNLU|nr:hypothetical protein ILUMI_09887 [Ignelater luminosus]
MPTAFTAIAAAILSTVFGFSALPLGIWNLEGYDLLYRIAVFTNCGNSLNDFLQYYNNISFYCSSENFQQQMQHGFIFIAILIQLCFYCIPANYIAREALAVADAIYFSDWYSQYYPFLKYPVCVMIQNAQHEITIKAGGLIDINAATVLNVSYNFYYAFSQRTRAVSDP